MWVHVFGALKIFLFGPFPNSPVAQNDALWRSMANRSILARRPHDGESVDRITLSLSSEDKAALSKIADQKRVSIAWVIRDAITRYLSEESKKSEG